MAEKKRLPGSDGLPDVRRMMTLYAGHLSWRSYEALCDAEDCEGDSLGPSDWPFTSYPTPFGWLMFVPDGWGSMPESEKGPVPDDVRAILDLAVLNHCPVVLLDWDGAEYPGLPVRIRVAKDGSMVVEPVKEGN